MTDRERHVAELLSHGWTLRAIARKVGVTEKTVYNYRQKPRVQAMVREFQEDIVESTGSQAASLVPEAITVLQSIVNNEDARDADRIQAARALMNGSAAFQERKLLERQITDLEQQLIPKHVLTTVEEVEEIQYEIEPK